MNFGDNTFAVNRAQTLAAKIEKTTSMTSLLGLAQEAQQIDQTFLDDGLTGALSTYGISWLNDALAARVVAITAEEARLPAANWCWIGLGSEGRHEQTLVTDQDNGLIFSASDENEADLLREVFLPFAKQTNQRLADCGFTLCSGDIMAGNPAWCRSEDEWKTLFFDWIHKPEPSALLNASIFFDVRPLYGDFSLVDPLREMLSRWAPSAETFLRLMATNALAAEPPIGFTGDVVMEKEGKEKFVDIKKYGIRIFVDVGRIIGLAHGVKSASTRTRFLQAGEKFGMSGLDVSAALQAMSELQRLRLNHQHCAITEGIKPDNHLHPEELSTYDEAVLREGLKQAKRLQQRLKLTYRI
ncbi:MAG: nucleotidyltransferase [Rhodocyclaceae bacterium]|nr:nucleotidyltransferase [Rhodocyclaceae bacterium]